MSQIPLLNSRLDAVLQTNQSKPSRPKPLFVIKFTYLDLVPSDLVHEPVLVLLVVEEFGYGREVESELVVDEEADLGIVVVSSHELDVGSVPNQVDV